MRLGTTEIILILFLALILFGGGKLSGVGKALGTSIKDFKKAVGGNEKTEEVQVALAEDSADSAINSDGKQV